MRTFLVSLSEHPLALLRGIAELRGVALASNVRSEVATQLAAALGEMDSTAAALAHCSDSAFAAWSAIRAAGGRMKLAAFSRVYGEIRPVGPGKLEREAIWREPASPAEELWYLGLAFRVFADLGDGPLEYIYIPEDLPLPALPAAPSPQTETKSPLPVVQPPRHIHQAQNTLAVDAVTVLARLRESPARFSKDGLDSEYKNSLRNELVSSDTLRLNFLLALMEANGWLAGDRERMVVDHQRAGAWLRAAPWGQVSALFAAWRETTNWNDLKSVPGIVAEGDWHNDPLLVRRTLTETLRRLDFSSWHSVEDLVAHIKATNPDFQRPDGAYSGWYLRDGQSGAYLSGFESWDAVEGRLLRFAMEGPLFWLGAVALGERHAGEPLAFRLTDWGAAWLTGRMPRNLPRPARLSIGDNFVVRAPLFVPLLDRFRLLRFTDIIAPESDKEDKNAESLQGTQHRVTRASLARGRESGVKSDAALGFLKRATGNRVPAKVAAAFARFAEMGGAVRLTRGAILRVADAATLGTLRADPALRPLLGELISAQAVMVRESDLKALQTLLRDSGYSIQID